MIKAILCSMLVVGLLAEVPTFAFGQSAETPTQTAEQSKVAEAIVDVASSRSLETTLGLTRSMHRAFQVDATLMASRGEPYNCAVQIRGDQASVEKARTWLLDAMAQSEKWEAADLDELNKNTVTMKFPGGTVEEFVNAALGKFDFVPPIYQSDELRTLRMRPVETKLMNITAALSLLSRMPPSNESGDPVPLRATWAAGGMGPVANRPYDVEPKLEVAQYRRQVLVIDRESKGPKSEVAAGRAVFSLSADNPIAKEKLDILLDAIGTAVNLEGVSKTFRAKFHTPSGLLIVRGTTDELGLVKQIVRATFPNARIELPQADSATETADTPTGTPPPQPNRPAR